MDIYIAKQHIDKLLNYVEDIAENKPNMYQKSKVRLKNIADTCAQVVSVISEILEDDSCEDNIFYGIIKNHEIMMFDEFARGNNVEIENADDLTEMLASVRMLSCEFVKNGSKRGEVDGEINT